MVIRDWFRRRGNAGNAANPPANNPPANAGNQANRQGGSTFSPRILIQQHGSKMVWVLVIIALVGIIALSFIYGPKATGLFVIDNIFPVIFFIILAASIEILSA